jgi:cysteine desulfurase
VNELIDLDANATTPLLPAARDAMFRVAGEPLGNPASAHALGRRGRRILEDAREKVADLLGAHPDEVIFTSGATEANNLAIFGLSGDSAAILASPMEHPCVIEPLRQLERRGAKISWLTVDSDGCVIPAPLGDSSLVTLQLVNHETGAIQPLTRFTGRAAIHTDAAQAVGKMPVNFRELAVASLAASAHKFRGPPGVGLLLLRRGVTLQPRTFGGHQQQGRRPGTESAMLAAGLAVALEHAVERIPEHQENWRRLRARLWEQLQLRASPVVLNGPPIDSPVAMASTLNVSFPGCRGDLLLMALDLAGVACSTGSACSSGSLLPSPVLAAMRVPEDVLRSAIRFSFAPDLELSTVDEAAKQIAAAVHKLRGQ